MQGLQSYFGGTTSTPNYAGATGAGGGGSSQAIPTGTSSFGYQPPTASSLVSPSTWQGGMGGTLGSILGSYLQQHGLGGMVAGNALGLPGSPKGGGPGGMQAFIRPGGPRPVLNWPSVQGNPSGGQGLIENIYGAFGAGTANRATPSG